MCVHKPQWVHKPCALCSLQLEVKMQVEYMSFSAHADAKGIMQLIRQAEPRNVLLVHGEAKKMEFLKQKIEQEFRTYRAGREEGMAAGGRHQSLGLQKRSPSRRLFPLQMSTATCPRTERPPRSSPTPAFPSTSPWGSSREKQQQVTHF